MTRGDSDGLDAVLKEAASIVAASKRLYAFTGAGISVESGIPPFRGPGGVWERYDPELLELPFFLMNPEESWETIRAIFYESMGTAKPNRAHEILAAWEREGRLTLVVTQNIDGLHEAAGSRNVVEFHGSTKRLVCLSCGKRVPADPALLKTLPPRCACGGIYKPDFVFFGEGIPRGALDRAFAAAAEADACLVIGSTGLVYPAADVPAETRRRGGAVIEINPEPTEFTDSIATLRVPLGASDALTRIDALLPKGPR